MTKPLYVFQCSTKCNVYIVRHALIIQRRNCELEPYRMPQCIRTGALFSTMEDIKDIG